MAEIGGDLKVSANEKTATTNKAGEGSGERSNSKLHEKVPVALWAMDLVEGDCSICHTPNNKPCLECQAQGIGYGCGTVTGHCSHTFHKHCMDNWFKNGGLVCPLDMSPWARNILL